MLKILRTSSLLYLLILILGAKTSKAQTIDYSLHANIIYHFTKYIEWPIEQRNGDFVIAIVGDSPLFNELKKTTLNKMAGNQKIIIKQFSAKQESFDCQILFISEDASGALKKIISSTQNLPVLIVTEEEGLGQKGSCINFEIINNLLTLEFNKIS